MADEKDIDLRIGLDTSEVSAGSDRVEQELEKVGAAGEAAGRQAGDGMKVLSEATDRARAAMQKVLDAPDLSSFETAVVEARNALATFRSAAESVAEELDGPVVEANRAAADAMEKMIDVAGTKVEKAMAGAGAELAKLGEEGKQAASALARLEAAGDSPRGLIKNAAAAEVAVGRLREAIDKATAEGKTFGPEVAASLAQAERQIEDAARKSRELADAAGDLGARGDQAAKGFEAMAGSAGSAEGILGQLANTSSKTEQAIAQVGFGVLAASEAFDFGYRKGEQLRETLTALGVPLPNLSTGLSTAIVNIERYVRSTNQAEGASKLLGGTFVEMAAKLALVAAGYAKAETVENEAIRRAREYQELREAIAKSESALATAFAQSGTSWNQGSDALAKLNLALADGELRLSRAMKSEKDWNVELRENGETYQKLAAQAREWGVELEKVSPRLAVAAEESRKYTDSWRAVEAAMKSVPETLVKLIPAVQNSTKGFTELENVVLKLAESNKISLTSLEEIVKKEMERQGATGQTKAAYEALLDAIDRLQSKGVETVRQIDLETDARARLEKQVRVNAEQAEKEFQAKLQRWAKEDARSNVTSPVEGQFKREHDAAVAAAVATGQFGTSLDRVAEAVVAAGGELKVGVPVFLQVTEVAEEMTQAFLKAAVAARQLREEQAESLSVTKGWTDYVIGLKQGYDDGIISLTTYISLLGAFRTQITQLFAGATGEAADAVKALQDLVTGLMSNIGPRDAGSGNRLLDDLNRSVKDAKGGKK